MSVYGRAITQAVVADLSDVSKDSVAAFLAEFRSACEKLTHWPAVTAAEVEYTACTDFTTPQVASYAYLKCMEDVSIQSLRSDGTSRPTGWGLLMFSSTPTWEVTDKYGPDQAFQSIGSR